MRRELDHTWTVFDVFTGVPVSVGTSVAIGMDEVFALELAGILNAAYALRRIRA
jgi:hypothetical protein